jgi:hypothetical protein
MIDTNRDKAIRCGQWLKAVIKEIPWKDHRRLAGEAIDELLRQCGVKSCMVLTQANVQSSGTAAERDGENKIDNQIS